MISHADRRWSPADADAPASAGYAVNRLDQYVSVNATPFTYDLNGDLTSDGVRAYTWTSENRLSAVTGAGVSATYSYDPLGRRVRKSVSGAVTEFLHAGDMEIADYDGQGQLLRRYIPDPGTDQRVAMIECDVAQAASQCRPGGTGVQTRLYFSDRLGSMMAVTNASG